MANLKMLRKRINSVKSTCKLTNAMKMISVSKLRKAQIMTLTSRTYAKELNCLVYNILQQPQIKAKNIALITSSDAYATHLLIVITSNNGLCGGYNIGITRYAKQYIQQLQDNKIKVNLLIIGTKGIHLLGRQYKNCFIEYQELPDLANLAKAKNLCAHIFKMFNNNEFEKCSIIYSYFINSLTQESVCKKLIPCEIPIKENKDKIDHKDLEKNKKFSKKLIYNYETEEKRLINDILKHNLTIQIYRALVESEASEQSARINAMDGANRNAHELIDTLNIKYNRQRQACITNELTEIIAGAEAV